MCSVRPFRPTVTLRFMRATRRLVQQRRPPQSAVPSEPSSTFLKHLKPWHEVAAVLAAVATVVGVAFTIWQASIKDDKPQAESPSSQLSLGGVKVTLRNSSTVIEGRGTTGELPRRAAVIFGASPAQDKPSAAGTSGRTSELWFVEQADVSKSGEWSATLDMPGHVDPVNVRAWVDTTAAAVGDDESGSSCEGEEACLHAFDAVRGGNPLDPALQDMLIHLRFQRPDFGRFLVVTPNREVAASAVE